MSSPGVTFNLTCGKGVTELQKLANLRLSSFAESHQMQQKNFDVSPYMYVRSIGKARTPIEAHKGDEKWPLFVIKQLFWWTASITLDNNNGV